MNENEEIKLKKNNLITVLVPIYNKEKFLPNFFNSILKQKDKNFNIIFLDDKSTDNSLKITKDFKNNFSHLINMKIIELEKNGGLANARNILIENCKTDYFLFLDPDDLIYKNALFYFNQKIQNNEYELVYSKFSLFFKKIKLLNFATYNYNRRLNWKIAKNSNGYKNFQGFFWNILINRKWFLSLNLSCKKGYTFEDFPVTTIMFLLSKNFGFTNKKTYKYCLNLNGLSLKLSKSKILGIAHNLDFLNNEIIKRELIDEYTKNYEWYFLKAFFVSLFYWKKYKFYKKNTKEYKDSILYFFEIAKKHNLINKLKKYKSWYSFLLKNSLYNYEKVYKLYNENNKK
ncbi:glycosyltransferase family 2 protein [[Mycoplasma] collis]|uniref:glycosyltransferase family 2 protein n=1 Tax=[Mycoplasma] collis TaxID=2127 RepID=UPI00051ACFCB|nr:glycosyltransferase family 2 protein [[Mycoplasma] collis]